MAKHSNLSGAALHYPIGRSSEGALDLEDDAQYAYQIKLGSSSMFNISTANSSETVSLGNSTDNPKILCPGTGDVGIGTLSPSSPNGNQVAVQLTGTSVGLVLDSTNGSGVPWEMQHNSGDMKIIYDGANTLGGGAKTAIALDAAGTMRLGAEVATPSDPGAGNGGFVYVKSDGKLYFRSNSTTETDLTAGGGGGVTNPMTADLTADGYYVKFNADTGIKDEAGNESLLFGKTTSAVNHMAVINAAAGGEATAEPSTAPALRAVGTTTNLDLALEAQGTGTVTIRSKGTDAGTLTLNAESNTKYVNIKPPLNDDLTSYTLVLPGDDGDADQVLKTDGSGNLDWVDQAAGGGGGYTVEAKSANFTAAVDYYYVIDSSAAVRTATLPSPSGQSGKKIGFKARHGSSNAVTIDRATNAADIDGLAVDYILNNNMASLELICDGTDWWII